MVTNIAKNMEKVPSTESVEQVTALLRAIRDTRNEIPDLRFRLKELEKEERLTQMRIDSMRTHGGEEDARAVRTMRDMCAFLNSQHADVERRLTRLRDMRAQFDRLLEALDSTQTRVIQLRWVDGRSWNAVATRVYLSDRSCQRVQKAAIARMANMLDETRLARLNLEVK